MKRIIGAFAILLLGLALSSCTTQPQEKDGYCPDLSHWDKVEDTYMLDENRYDLGFISRGASYTYTMENEHNFSVPLILTQGMQVGEKSDFTYEQNEKPCFCLDLYYGDEECVMFYFFDDFKYVGYIESDSEYNNPWDMPKYELLNGEDMKLLFQNYKFYFTYDELDRVNKVVEDFMQKYPDLLSAIVETDVAVEKAGNNGEEDSSRYLKLDYSIFWTDYQFESSSFVPGIENQFSDEKYFTQKMLVHTKNDTYTYTFRVQKISDGDYQLTYVLVSKS